MVEAMRIEFYCMISIIIIIMLLAGAKPLGGHPNASTWRPPALETRPRVGGNSLDNSLDSSLPIMSRAICSANSKGCSRAEVAGDVASV